MKFAYVLIIMGSLYYFGLANSIGNNLKKNGQKPNLMNCYIPIYQVDNYDSFFLRSQQQATIIWVILGLIVLLLLRLGIIKDGLYIYIIGYAIIFSSIFFPGYHVYKNMVGKK